MRAWDERRRKHAPANQRAAGLPVLVRTEAAQLAEFAIALPLLVVLVVGIFDFASAFNLKQKLTQAAREGAHVAANQPTADLSNNPPPSILAVRDVVDNYLLAAQVNDCGPASAWALSNSGLAWTYTSTSGACPGPLTLTIDRGHTFPSGLPDPYPKTIEATKVTLVYPYKWQFSSVFQLLAPGASYGTTKITTVAVMQNMN